MKKTLKVVWFRVGREPVEIIIENDLKSMQTLVGGYIEVVSLPNEYVLVCNEEGLILGLGNNTRSWMVQQGLYIAGDFFIARQKDDSIVSVPDAMIENVKSGIFR